MTKEKFVVIIFLLITSLVSLDVLSILFPFTKKFKSFNNTTFEEPNNLSDNGNTRTYDRIPLSVSGWGLDIFHDRTNIYNDWFELTGITQFENDYKAIVNGEIVGEMDRVRGFTVTEINSRKVILKRNDYIVTLKLEE